MRSANFDRHRALYLRERAKLSQAELATKVGVHQTAISLIESGKREPSFEMAEAICRALGVPDGELITPKVA